MAHSSTDQDTAPAAPPLGALGRAGFLQDYWQKQPCLVRQAFPGFVPELDENDVAGLACEELAEARLVRGSFPAHDWSVRYGPFSEDDLANLGDTDWTLLVQDVEKHYPPLRALMAQFNFLPGWRLDDLMVSVAAPGGSVGPHVDQYDVFLLQASGRRRWQISRQFEPGQVPGAELNVLRAFEPEQEWVLEAGDLLYLPPGVAHHGVALDLGMTWSIGLRAPSQADLLQAFGDWLAEHRGEGQRYQDPPLTWPLRPGEIDRQARTALRQLVTAGLAADGSFDEFIGEFLSEFRLAHQPAGPDEQPASAGTIDQLLLNQPEIQLNPWTRLAWFERGGHALLFAAGTRFDCSVALAEALCRHPPALLPAAACTDQDLDTLRQLVNQGHLLLVDEAD